MKIRFLTLLVFVSISNLSFSKEFLIYNFALTSNVPAEIASDTKGAFLDWFGRYNERVETFFVDSSGGISSNQSNWWDEIDLLDNVNYRRFDDNVLTGGHNADHSALMTDRHNFIGQYAAQTNFIINIPSGYEIVFKASSLIFSDIIEPGNYANTSAEIIQDINNDDIIVDVSEIKMFIKLPNSQNWYSVNESQFRNDLFNNEWNLQFQTFLTDDEKNSIKGPCSVKVNITSAPIYDYRIGPIYEGSSESGNYELYDVYSIKNVSTIGEIIFIKQQSSDSLLQSIQDLTEQLATANLQTNNTTSSGMTMDEAQAAMRDLRVGSQTFGVSNGNAKIRMYVDESGNLTDWTNTPHVLELDIPADTDTKFFRFRMD